jgi:hypothetical protein
MLRARVLLRVLSTLLPLPPLLVVLLLHVLQRVMPAPAVLLWGHW